MTMVSRVISKASKFHITTPIYYPNAKPHLGHLYSSLLCDVQYRWGKLTGKDALFTTGLDEHGLKIQAAAQQKGFKNPKEFVDKLCPDFLNLYSLANIKYTRFLRTTDLDHVENVQKLWTLCFQNGYIYKGTHKGWYSISDETFYPESKVVKLGPDSEMIQFDGHFDPNAKYINTESRNEVVFQSEVNYFFKLSAFQQKLIDLLKSNAGFIHPPSRHLQILRELESNKLNDISVSRPVSRLEWGISVPHDSSQKVYVWFDALCNYVTSIGGIDAIKNDLHTTPISHSTMNIIENPKQWWQNTEHLIGKDIIKFHTIYWPAFLLAAKLPLPKRVVVHGHWLSGGIKMSKSLGNVIDPVEMIQYYGADTMRWYMLENSFIEGDGNFVEKNLHGIREMLCSKLGNLINRCCGKKFSVRQGVLSFHAKDPSYLREVIGCGDLDALNSMIENLNMCKEKVDACILSYDMAGALKNIWNIINEANAFVQNTEPWAKQGAERDLIIFTAMEAARISLIISQPIIPQISSQLLKKIGVTDDKRTLDYAIYGADGSYGENANAKKQEPPLPRIPYRLET